ncbi:hypothetical protein [Caballeronia sp. GAFFF2]|uniref:hypothetical protein n=1 Tax=Caballeronia sp. GAFFF2 TaxID=2921741 RepID=UPI002027F6B9|nr:hypothetical protein [Caballeronia sp. GAFFF2]
MPVDLSDIGEPYPYPAHGPRLLPWLGIWLTCCAVGAPLILLMWPSSEPASGAAFWVAVIGGPHAVFLGLLCFARIAYEAMWHYAHNCNTARAARLAARLRIAQKRLQVLGVGYCVPSVTSKLSAIVTMTTPLFKSQMPRSGAGLVVHNRFDDEAWSEEPQPEPEDNEDQANEEHDQACEAVPKIATVVLKLVDALAPLIPALQALAQYGPQYAPLARVLAHPDEMDLRTQQARDALRIAGAPALECAAEPAPHNLMLADAWLDSRERRALLILAFAWHDADPPANSSEAAVAVLLSPGFYQLPEPIRVLATLHRPVEELAGVESLRDLICNTTIWGKAEPQTITRAWLTRLERNHDSTLLDTLKQASFTGIATRESHGRLDRVLGNAGAANAWLSIAAAIESRLAGPHLIVDRLQSAILYVNTNPLHDHTEYAGQQPESA